MYIIKVFESIENDWHLFCYICNLLWTMKTCIFITFLRKLYDKGKGQFHIKLFPENNIHFLKASSAILCYLWLLEYTKVSFRRLSIGTSCNPWSYLSNMHVFQINKQKKFLSHIVRLILLFFYKHNFNSRGIGVLSCYCISMARLCTSYNKKIVYT